MKMSMEDPRIEDLKQSISQLHQKLDGHCHILARLEDLQVLIDNDIVNQKYLSCARDRERKLVQAVQEAILVLEESRKAFRSKKLENLRINLMRTLSDIL